MNSQSTATITADPFAAAIRNPDNPDHLMVIKPIEHRVRIFSGETLIAESTDAVRVIEVGKSIYNPTVYLPDGDLVEVLEYGSRTTHCPLKGDARYASYDGKEVGWRYQTFDFSAQLSGRTGFLAPDVQIIEG